MPIKDVCNKGGNLMVVFDKPVSGQEHEEDVLFRQNLKICVIKMRDVRSNCCSHVSARLIERRSTPSQLVIIL